MTHILESLKSTYNSLYARFMHWRFPEPTAQEDQEFENGYYFSGCDDAE